MSLLMDALRRAEETKRQKAAQGEAPAGEASPDVGGTPELTLEPPPTPLPDLATHLAEVDAELEAAAEATTPPLTAAPAATGKAPPAATAAGAQAAARSVFAAKQSAAAATTQRQRIIVIVALGLLLAAGLGAYFYYQYRQLSDPGLRLASGVRPPAGTAPATPIGRPAVGGDAARPMAPTAPAAPAAPAAPTAPAAAVAAAAPPPAAPTMDAAAPTTGLPAAPAKPRPVTPPASREEAPTARGAVEPHANERGSLPSAATSVRITGGTSRLNPALASGYQQLLAGDLDAARVSYEQALKADPHNVDALNALATLASRDGQTDRAQSLYVRALTADPKNATALAGLIGLSPQVDPVQAESRLKSALSGLQDDPAQVATVQFALGNLYAAQRRWNEAQHAYFQAYAADAGNPDYHYNLAVSLDHLQQTRLAVQFYQSALAAANARPAAFDRAQIQARLNELQR